MEISDDQLKQLKIILSRHLTGGKILPYSDEMNSSRTEFKKMAKMDLSELDFWAIDKLHGSKCRPPCRAKVATIKSEEGRKTLRRVSRER